MGFGDSGHPVPTDVGSPEHANARARDLRGSGPRGDNPHPRPGCLRAIVGLFVVLAAVIVLVWLVGMLLDGG